MLFNSLEFFLFLAIVLAIYYSLNHRGQNYWLVAASYAFYGFWDWRFLSLILVSTVVDFILGQRIHRAEGPNEKKLCLIISLLVNLGILAFFKYFNFFIDSAVDLLSLLGFEAHRSTLNIILPVGISFYTFQTLSYSIDIYRGNLKPIKNITNFALFVSFFPQLVAGPIERATNLLPQIGERRSVSTDDLREGVWLILVGLFRKVVIADTAAIYVNAAFGNPGSYSSTGLLVAAFLFSVQIYGDFAGYSDIARGVSRLLGFKLMINFQQPYFSSNIAEFWRRWHISLSSWLRDYLYIGLGGNRSGALKTYRNLFLTMLLGGLWHGAAWGFILWGALHGSYLAIHRLMGGSANSGQDGHLVIRLLKIVSLFFLVTLTWIPFRQPDGALALQYLSGILQFQGSLFDTANPGKVLEPGLCLVLVIMALLLIDLPMYRKGIHTAVFQWPLLPRAALYFLMVTLILLFGGRDEVAFIYFQF